ncbi:MAG: hypothetical protein DDT19_00773 [Syntrophomonadaceae bacterium]|nr:hypothetical protein [Bacillota bacterium]
MTLQNILYQEVDLIKSIINNKKLFDMKNLRHYLLDNYKHLKIVEIMNKINYSGYNKEALVLIKVLRSKRFKQNQIAFLLAKSISWTYYCEHNQQTEKEDPIALFKSILILSKEGKKTSEISKIIKKSYSYVYSRLNNDWSNEKIRKIKEELTNSPPLTVI